MKDIPKINLKMFSLLLFYLVLRLIFLTFKFHPSLFRFRTNSSLSVIFFISVHFISEDIQGYFFSLWFLVTKKIKALRYKNSWFLSFYLFFCSLRTCKRKTSLFKGGLIFHCSVHTIVPIKMSPPLTRGMLKAGSTATKIVIPSADELLAIKYADYIKTFFTYIPNSVSYFPKDDFLPTVQILNWVLTQNPRISSFFYEHFDSFERWDIVRDAYIKGADLNPQESAVFYDSAKFSPKHDAPRVYEIIDGIRTCLDIKLTDDKDIIHPLGYGAQLKDISGKELKPDALKEGGTIVDCCKANYSELVSKHQEKEQKYTKNTSLDYETLYVAYASSAPQPKIPINNLIQKIYPQLAPPDIPTTFPFPIPSHGLPYQQAYPHIHPLKTIQYQAYKQEMKTKFASIAEFDDSKLK